MPLIPKGLTTGLIQRVKDRLKRELGMAPSQRPPPSGPQEILMRVQEAASQDPPCMVRALYQAKDAQVATWRLLQPYSIRARAEDGAWLLYAGCEKDNWNVESFDLRRFKDLQVTNLPFTPKFDVEWRGKR